jgi:hypothetical protein
MAAPIAAAAISITVCAGVASILTAQNPDEVLPLLKNSTRSVAAEITNPEPQK